ncbi:DMT family transporter [Leucobacter aridicollis]|uniref:Transporter family-2 protein n=1 Tax=Leucobacter aridicollis TaxID=283878 RepID=A0A852RCD1_9MICO|nr:DMT family transporter [Leucobacter aridicollis]MBL3680928.1 DMT family transporter [Leucobacter aridicollis]NYD28069.1 transporter family-2 protein [Leucobacter aridicollis]
MNRRQQVEYVTALVGAVLAGTSLALQTAVNGGLSEALGNPVLAAFLSFTVGLLIVSLVALLNGQWRERLIPLLRIARSRTVPWWCWSGGIAGAYFVFAQSASGGTLGVALFTIGVVGGQSIGGLLLDRIGVGPAGGVPVTGLRVAGAATTVCAVGISAISTDTPRPLTWVLLLPVLAGVGVSWQATANGALANTARSVLAAAIVNFAFGWMILAFAAAVSLALGGWPGAWPGGLAYYVGGVFGVVFIAACAALLRVLGALVLGVATVVGQMVASVVIDSVLTEAPTPSMFAIGGVFIAALAAIMVAWPNRRSGA